MRCAWLVLACLALVLSGGAQTPTASSEPAKLDYLVYVVCESADKIVLLRFGPDGLRIENQTANRPDAHGH